ncbi:MerR family transcriptional regulator [Phormidium sp. CLA17]|uniref:MerR family transcriptional regulator n=1 Tax=Leptolyngbya sp. Cla-17 TaxID=2803751 RepID=UPI001490B105|nr:MerR family transcriptional regulator [Leptolyngbya sp. Cla-17]MBM0740582.1 MerR family transcriptional regulator [Leptolyngbya sp. Cla-17]
MESTFTIQEAAQQTGVSTYTLRYYERMNLLDSIHRDESGYRRFTADDIACVQFLMKLRATQMPIRQMRQFAELRRQGLSTAHQRRLLLEEHYDAVIVSQRALNQSLEIIRKKIAYYKELEAKESANRAELHPIPSETSRVQAGINHHSIHFPLEVETAAQALIHHLDPESISRLIEQLQSKTTTGVTQ